MTKLSDEHLAAWAEFDGEGIIDFGEIQQMVAELRERRAADLTADDKDALRRLAAELRSDITKLASPTHEEQILAVLAKIGAVE